jgi:glyoxylase I family protein
MPIQSIDHYNLRAAEEVIERLKDFYQDVLGLQIGPRPAFTTNGYWLYANSLPIVHLSVMRSGEHHPPNVANTLDHIALTCTDFDGMVASLDSHSIRYTVDQVPGLGHRQIFFADPAGNGVELNFVPGA